MESEPRARASSLGALWYESSLVLAFADSNLFSEFECFKGLKLIVQRANTDLHTRNTSRVDTTQSDMCSAWGGTTLVLSPPKVTRSHQAARARFLQTCSVDCQPSPSLILKFLNMLDVPLLWQSAGTSRTHRREAEET